MVYTNLGLVAVLLFCSTSLASASWGDNLNSYQNCLLFCTHSCNHNKHIGKSDLSWTLKLFGWSCEDECKYNCMHRITAEDVANRKPIKQFYGKWPFIRFLGIQEPASTLFSILNGVCHIAGWLHYRSVVPQNYIMYNLWKAYMLVNVNAWTWSTVFHARDLHWTEKMDYFSATSLVLMSLFCIFVRVVGPDNKWKCVVFAVFLLTMFFCHIAYLSLIKFDYGYNIQANVAIGIINVLSWLLWCIKHYPKQRYVWKCMVISISVFFLVGLEVFDFPPIWWTFDAHSLWHCGTIPFCYFWYSFIIDDARYQLQDTIKEKKE